jgi:hypothetical protein
MSFSVSLYKKPPRTQKVRSSKIRQQFECLNM